MLLGLVALPPPSDPTLSPILKINRYGSKLQEKIDGGRGLISRKYWTSKPGPPGLFPYMARVEYKGTPLHTGFRAPSLFKHFAEYGPLAAGRSTEASCTCYYLCLPTAETLERFSVVWSVTPAHHEPFAPLTAMKDLVESMKQRQFSEEAQLRRLQREQRKAEILPDDPVGSMTMAD